MNHIPHINYRPEAKTECMQANAEGLRRAADLLLAGETVAVPTETVYGLAANGLDAAAGARIYSVKGRPLDNPLIIHVARRYRDFTALAQAGLLPPLPAESVQRSLFEAMTGTFWPGPLTIVMPKGRAVPDEVTAGLPCVALRMPAHPALLALLDQLPFPLAAPSANRSNRVSPTAAEHVIEELGGRIPLVLDGGPCEVGLESTIVAIEADGCVRLLRPGGLPREKIETVIGAKVQTQMSQHVRLSAPGMRNIHYAPRTRLILASRNDSIDTLVGEAHGPKNIGILLLTGDAITPPDWRESLGRTFVHVRSLGDHGDGVLASRRLFLELRELDRLGLDLILVERTPESEKGLWPAVADRLSRAAAAFSLRPEELDAAGRQVDKTTLD